MRRTAFTLIELLIVVIIIGVLAAIAIPRFSRSKDKAFVVTMMSDLKNLSTAQSSYFADNQTYTTTIPAAQYRPSAGVTVTIGSATNTGWSASASHPAVAKTCTISVGSGAANDGQPVCS